MPNHDLADFKTAGTGFEYIFLTTSTHKLEYIV